MNDKSLTRLIRELCVLETIYKNAKKNREVTREKIKNEMTKRNIERYETRTCYATMQTIVKRVVNVEKVEKILGDKTPYKTATCRKVVATEVRMLRNYDKD